MTARNLISSSHWRADDEQDPVIGTASINVYTDGHIEVYLFHAHGPRGALTVSSQELAARFLQRAGYRCVLEQVGNAHVQPSAAKGA